jgi:Coenzyme PQQ synthesis protein D (PqqD)
LETYRLSQVSIPKNVLVQTFENESVLLNLDSEQYHGLDDVGTSMWLALTQTGTIQAAFERLLTEYQVEPGTLKQDLDDFVKKLRQRGLVELSAGQSE